MEMSFVRDKGFLKFKSLPINSQLLLYIEPCEITEASSLSGRGLKCIIIIIMVHCTLLLLFIKRFMIDIENMCSHLVHGLNESYY